MITQDAPGRESRAAHPGSGCETPALRGALIPDGTAQAHAGRGLTCAVLALRELAAAVTGLGATLGIIAGAVTGTGGQDAAPALEQLAAQVTR